MKATKLLVLSLIFSFAFLSTAFAQTIADEGYDRTSIDEPGQMAGTSLVQDLDEIKRRAIENIINRIRQGDVNVLKYVVYDVFVEVHKAILQESRERTKRNQNSQPVSYYEVIGGASSLPSFYGCFDNQDPKVRLRCIGYLGDWIDDMGIAMNDIGRQANDRLHSNIETRIEVRYGLILLTLKVIRKTKLNRIWNGDEDELRTIIPEHFAILVHREPFIREMFCIPHDVRLRSIRLLQWWLQYYDEMGGVYWYRTLGDEENERTLTNQYTPFRNLAKELELRLKVNNQYLLYRNYGGVPAMVLSQNRRATEGYGYQDPGGYQDICSLYDLRYFRYSNQEQLEKIGPFDHEELYLPAIFSGLENTSLFVRENVARLLVRLTDGPVGFMQRDNADYSQIRIGSGDNSFIAWDDIEATKKGNSRKATPYELLDDTNNVVGVQGLLSRLAKNTRYQTVIRQAWKDVQFAQFMDVHELSRSSSSSNATSNSGSFPEEYNQNDGIKLERNVDFRAEDNSWGYKYNYRTDIADLMRRFNLRRELEYCDRQRTQPPQVTITGGTYFVEDLFDLDEQSRAPFAGSNVHIPLWHGKDEIKDEVFEP
jgi:hypothetical protein